MKDLINRNSLLNSLEKFAPEKHDALVEMLIKKEPTVNAVPVSDVINWLYDYEKEARNLLAIYKASEVIRWMIHDFEVMVLERKEK